MKHILSVHEHFPLVGALLAGQKARDAHRGDRFARSRLAHKAQDLSVAQREAHACHRFSVSIVKFNMEISDFQHQSTSLFIFCIPSPIRLMPNTRRAITPPTLSAYQGAERNMPCASESI